MKKVPSGKMMWTSQSVRFFFYLSNVAHASKAVKRIEMRMFLNLLHVGKKKSRQKVQQGWNPEAVPRARLC